MEKDNNEYTQGAKRSRIELHHHEHWDETQEIETGNESLPNGGIDKVRSTQHSRYQDVAPILRVIFPTSTSESHTNKDKTTVNDENNLSDPIEMARENNSNNSSNDTSLNEDQASHLTDKDLFHTFIRNNSTPEDTELIRLWIDRYRGLGGRSSPLLNKIFPTVEFNTPASEDDRFNMLIQAAGSTIEECAPRPINFQTVEELLRKSERVIVIVGAGVSTSSGIPDFRSEKTGLYARLKTEYTSLPRPESMFDMDYFLFDPYPFFEFAKELFPGNFNPTPSHHFIKRLEDAGKLLRCYTQNIDTLEEAVGITRLLQCHGSFSTATCIVCGYKVSGEDIRVAIFKGEIPLCPLCPAPSQPIKEIVTETSKALNQKNVRTMSFKDTMVKETTIPSKEESLSDSATAKANIEDSGCNSGNMVEHDQSSEDDFPVSITSQNITQSDQHSNQSSDEQSNFAVHGKEYRNTSVESQIETGEINSHKQHGSPQSSSDEQSDDDHQTVLNLRQRGIPIMKPDIVFFHEGLPSTFYDLIEPDLEESDLILVMGSSLQVGPVNMIPKLFNGPTVLINREPILSHEFTAELLGDCDLVCHELAARLKLSPLFNEQTSVPMPSQGNNQSSCDMEERNLQKQQSISTVDERNGQQKKRETEQVQEKRQKSSLDEATYKQPKEEQNSGDSFIQQITGIFCRERKRIRGFVTDIHYHYPHRFLFSESSRRHLADAALLEFLPFDALHDKASTQNLEKSTAIDRPGLNGPNSHHADNDNQHQEHSHVNEK